MDTRLLYLVYCCICVAAIFLPQGLWPSGPGDGACVPWRPAAFNYISVWSILCALLTISLTMATTTSSTEDGRIFHHTHETYARLCLYGGLLCCVFAWSPAYHNKKADGVTVFLWMLLLALPLLVLLSRTPGSDETIALATLSPLVVWVLFQMCVNIQEVSMQRPKNTTGHV